MNLIEKIWYQKLNAFNAVFIILLFPFTLLFALITFIRRSLYKAGKLKSVKVSVPVIVVGGISVGGTGKTPLCIALLKKLADSGYRPGLISRGYRGKAPSYPFTVQTTTLASECGDEPLLIKMTVQDKAVVAVDPDRERGAEYLVSLGCNVIVTDDGLQHYSLRRDIEVIVVDGVRMLGNGFLMPSGPLREGSWRLDTADAVVINGFTRMAGADNMELVPAKAVSLNTYCVKGADTVYLEENSKVYAMAGIGNPVRFYKTVTNCGYKIEDTIKVPDHGLVDIAALKKYAKTYPVLMTAKDAVKYAKFQLENVYVLNVHAKVENSFFTKILSKLEKLNGK